MFNTLINDCSRSPEMIMYKSENRKPTENNLYWLMSLFSNYTYVCIQWHNDAIIYT